jgi:hypothetical protein
MVKVDPYELPPGGRRGIPRRFRIGVGIKEFKPPPRGDRMIVRSKGADAQGPARFPGGCPVHRRARGLTGLISDNYSSPRVASWQNVTMCRSPWGAARLPSTPALGAARASGATRLPAAITRLHWVVGNWAERLALTMMLLIASGIERRPRNAPGRVHPNLRQCGDEFKQSSPLRSCHPVLEACRSRPPPREGTIEPQHRRSIGVSSSRRRAGQSCKSKVSMPEPVVCHLRVSIF